jgi:hypothetical protein
MLSVLLAVGLGVDISKFYLAKNELQNAADASALAAVSALNGSSDGITEAANRAVQGMNSYNFNKSGASFPRSNVLFAVNLGGPYVAEGSAKGAPKDIRFVQVTTQASPVGVSFAAAVLGNSKNLTATATAGFSVPLNSICGWIPVSVIDYDIPMAPGNTYTIRSDAGGHVSPGNYQVLAVAGSGGKDVRVGIASGVDLCASPGAVYEVDTKPGMTSGPVRQGMNTRFGDYSGGQVDSASQPPDSATQENINYDAYRDIVYDTPPAGTVPGRRVVIIPIVKLSEYDQGRNTVKFNRFGLFFLQTKVGGGNGGELVAEYIRDTVVVGKGKYDATAGPVNELLATPVLYK